MIVERSNKEILVRLSPKTNISDLQDMLDFLEYKELVSKSKATQSDIDALSKQVNRSIMKRVRKTRE